jgi:hypothetical protein
MRALYTILVLAILLAISAAWSFTNVAMSIDRLIRSDTSNDTWQVLDFNGNDTTEATVSARIIVVPRRKVGNCQPGQQRDRRGKCRTIW